MDIKLFISYCHKDDEYREALETHLSLLRRNGEILSWSDRKIIPGQEWGGEISEALELADIIVLLVSADFINSDYCYDKEVKRAIEKHENKTAIVVPILIRACDWHDSPFGKLQALPRGAIPVRLWPDEDSAWLDVVVGVRESIKNLGDVRSVQEVDLYQEELIGLNFKEEFTSWLEDTDVQLSHRNVSEVLLSDIYVSPHLKDLSKNVDDLIRPVDVEEILASPESVLIFGDEQTGKTSLAKHMNGYYLGAGYTPIFVNGRDVSSTSLDDILKDSISKQYKNLDPLSVEKLPNKILILDNFSEIKLNKKHANKFIDNCNNYFSRVILFALESYQYVAKEIEETDSYSYYEILSLGHLKRTEIVRRWVSLGVVEQIEEENLYSQIDDITLRLDSLVRGNVVPPKPIFLLTMLQMFEAYTPQNLELTSYGHCYQYLVYQALEKSGIKSSEIDKYLNVITELSWEFYKKGKRLDRKQVEKFFNEYKKKYVLSDSGLGVMRKLTGNSILIERDDFYSFKYPYVYYFFVAKKIAEAFSSDSNIKEEIRTLLASLHQEDCANIIIFITHHTKESWILDEIQICLMGLFEDQPEATLSSDSLSFMEEFLAEIPDLVIEHKEIESVRRERDEVIDDIEWSNSNEIGAGDDQGEIDGLEPSDILAKINMVFKGIEIVGQILRNRHASIHKDLLYQMVEFSTSTGLRFLQYFIEISDVSRDEVIKMLSHMLRENPAIRDSDLEKEAKNTFLFLTYGVIFGVLRKISSSIGSKEADEIYDELEAKVNTPAIKLINQAIGLQFKKNLDFKKLDELTRDFTSNPTCTRILKEIVIQHVYMFPVDYKEKQKIESTMGIPIKGQRLIAQQKKLKI